MAERTEELRQEIEQTRDHLGGTLDAIGDRVIPGRVVERKVNKVRESLDAALKIEPRHAEAHTALALYHAEIIGKIGAMIGGLTYGAKAAEAESHIKTALKLTPDSPIAHVEHANVLLLLYGEKKEDAAAGAFEKASKLEPRDAMEALDAAHARAQIE